MDTQKVKDTFSKYLAEIDIEDFETGEKIGYWEGEPEDSNLMVIIRKAEDGDVYDGLLNVVRMANTVLKQMRFVSRPTIRGRLPLGQSGLLRLLPGSLPGPEYNSHIP